MPLGVKSVYREFDDMFSEIAMKEIVKSIESALLKQAKKIVGMESINITDLDKSVVKDVGEGNFFSSYKERLDQTPANNSERGYWQGERGESKFVPVNQGIQEILAKNNMDGVLYRDAIPDFSPCSEGTVIIENMTSNRANNFKQCDQKCAELWNNDAKNDKIDWTPRDIANWRNENGYSWHERNDMKTCDLIPTETNDYFGHLGGVSECKRFDVFVLGDGFDV